MTAEPAKVFVTSHGNDRYWMERIVIPALTRMLFAGPGPYLTRAPWRP